MKNFCCASSGGLRQIDLAVLEALDQILGGDVHQHDVVGVAEDDVGHGLANDDARHARNDVGEALQMLNVERRPYVDAGAEQLLDVLPALGVAALRRVGVGEFVDDDQLGPSAERRIEIELLDLRALIVHDAARQNFEIARQRFRLGAAVGFDETDDDVDALLLDRPRALQHRKRLADAGRGADEYEQPAALALLGQREQGVGIGSTFGVAFGGQGSAASPVRGVQYNASWDGSSKSIAGSE